MSNIYQIVSDVRSIFEEEYDYSVDSSLARMTPEDVMEIVNPIAEEKKMVYEDRYFVVRPYGPNLKKCLKTQQLIWTVPFSHTKKEDKDFEHRITLTAIEIDDETGEIIKIWGMDEES